MKKLRNKTFITIFTIFTIFIILILTFYNIQNYKREYDGVKNNLIRINDLIKESKRRIPIEDKNRELDNKFIMDYDVYTILLDKNNSIIDIINHSDNTNINITTVAETILTNNKDNIIKINNLYTKGYSYNLLNNNYLVIINTNNISKRLVNSLSLSLIILLISLIIIYFLTKIITNFLVKPAEETYIKQREFIADASHELKTPIAVIMASTDAVENEPKEKKYLNNIKDQTEKMNNLITNLLNLSKLEESTNKELYTKENISKLIEKEALTFESLAFENNTSIETIIKENIILNCNPIEIQELLSILIDNAIKHTKNKKTINITLNEKKNDIILEVTNYGDTIAKEDYEKIFERFYRVDKSRNRSSNRYGLGLAIAKSIVLKHNGKISVASNNGYTTFKIILKKNIK